MRNKRLQAASQPFAFVSANDYHAYAGQSGTPFRTTSERLLYGGWVRRIDLALLQSPRLAKHTPGESMVEALGWAAFLAGLLGTLLLMSERGYLDGMRTAWFVATLAIPAWFAVTIRSITLDAVTGVGLAAILATLVRPFAGARSRWVLTDLLIGAVVTAAIVSDIVNRKLIPGTVVELTRMWVLPYLVGRLCVESWDRMQGTIRLVVILATALSLFALFEATTKVNLLAISSGKKWDLLEKAEGFRWGLKRAQGTTNHPIYFGLLMVLTLPWLLVAACAAVQGKAPRWWRYVPIPAVAAAFVTVSRSAHLAIVVVFVTDVFFRRPFYRGVMILIAIVGGLTLLAFREEALDLLGKYAGEQEIGNDRVVIYGVQYDYTGTRHRDLLLLAYDEAIQRAGWVGYGTTFPSKDMPQDENMDRRFASVDHQYLLHYLKYGYLGLAALMAFALSSAWNLAREAIFRDGPWSELAAAMFGAFVAVALLMRGVAMLPDFGATWLFVAGISASLRARRASAMRLPPQIE